jgi:hypothetical protein
MIWRRSFLLLRILGFGLWTTLAPRADALNVFQVGNSFTADSMANSSYLPWAPQFPIGTEVMLEQALGEPVNLGYHIRSNTTLDYMWFNPTAEGTNITSYGNHTVALPGNDWDYLVLQSFPSITEPIPTLSQELSRIQDYMTAADLGGGGDTKLVVFGPWAGRTENYWYDWYSPVIDSPDTESIYSAAYHNLLYDKAAELFPGRVQLASAAKVMRRIRDLIVAGQAPIASTNSLYRDAIHLSSIGRFIGSSVIQTVILGHSTVGLELDRTVPDWETTARITDEQAAWIQLVTWEVLSADSRSGVLAPAAGDYDGNGVIDAGDYDVWATFYGSTTRLLADGDNSGVVDLADYTLWRDAYLAGLSIGVPEPSAALLVATLGASLLARRRIFRKPVVRGVNAA